jgi:hypothetical protein
MLPTQFIPDFFVAEYYGLRNTIFWGSYRISPQGGLIFLELGHKKQAHILVQYKLVNPLQKSGNLQQ